MEKRLRSSLQTSAEEFLSSATKIDLKVAKSALKTLIWSINSSSSFSSSLPPALHFAITRSLDSFKKSSESNGSDFTKSPSPPPLKRVRRSSRHCVSPDKSNGEKNHSERQILLNNLRIYAHIAHLCISHPQKPFPPTDLLPSVQALHDSLILFEMDPILLSEIAILCEEWWKECLPGRETLISQSLPFLLSRSLTLGKKVNLHRVYVLRNAFTLFDFVDESIEDLKLLLVRCVITPLYLKVEEGRRFIAFLFGLNEQLVKEALAMIRSQIPFGRKSVLEAYADILFRAWKITEGSSRDEIENGFLQGLIEGAIHASSRQFSASIRKVLGGFINQRMSDGVEKLLFRLTEPVLFRSLQVTNSNVRQNALHLLLDMFPLEDPDANKEVKDTLLDKQFFLLEKLVLDDCPEVRVVAVEGSCRILRLFWEIIPSPTITKILTKIVDDMSNDTCNEVRISTLSGFIYLLDNPQSHEILKVLLPRLGHMFLDTALSVRMAVADLLLALRDIRAFQFNKVVGLDALMSSLANDHPHVAKKITRLLIPSYFPSKVTLKEACNRCIALIKRSPASGARFCEFVLSEGSSPKSLLELIKVFVNLVLSPNDLSRDQIDGFFVAAANLCRNFSTETSCKTELKEFFSGNKLKRLLTAATTGRAQASVLSIAFISSPDDVAGLLQKCSSLIINCGGLSESVERQAEVRSAHKLMLSCGWFDDLFGALTNILQTAASAWDCKLGSKMAKKNMPCIKRKKVKLSMKWTNASGKRSPNSCMPNSEEGYFIAAGAAWQIKDLLISEDTRNAVLKSTILDFTFSSLKVISEVNIEQCMNSESLDLSPVLAYTALAMHMSLQNVDLTRMNNLDDDKDDGLHSTSSSQEGTLLDHSLNRLIDCTEKLFCAINPIKSSNSPSKLNHKMKSTEQCQRSKRREFLSDISSPTNVGPESKPSLPETKRIPNIVKMATTILKFVVDANTMRLVSRDQEKCLRFTSAYAQYITSALERHSHNLSFNEDDWKETLACLRSSFTYAAKLLNLVLTASSESSPPPLEASYLANDLLDLITSTESHLGSLHAARFVAVAKPWLPDLILALSSCHVPVKTTQEEGSLDRAGCSKTRFPAWLAILGKVEFCELKELGQDEQADTVPELKDFSVFRKLTEMVVLLLKKGNPKILDGFGVVFLNGSAFGLKNEDFGLVLGLLHFLCVKMLGHEYREWKELELTLSSVREIYFLIKKDMKNTKRTEDERGELESAKALLEPVISKHHAV